MWLRLVAYADRLSRLTQTITCTTRTAGALQLATYPSPHRHQPVLVQCCVWFEWAVGGSCTRRAEVRVAQLQVFEGLSPCCQRAEAHEAVQGRHQNHRERAYPLPGQRRFPQAPWRGGLMRVRAAMVLLSQMLKLWEQLRVLRDTEEKARRAGMSREEALKAEANDLFKVWNHVEVSASVWLTCLFPGCSLRGCYQEVHRGPERVQRPRWQACLDYPQQPVRSLLTADR